MVCDRPPSSYANSCDIIFHRTCLNLFSLRGEPRRALLPFASITWSRFNGSVPKSFGTLSASTLGPDPTAGWLPMCQAEVRTMTRTRQGQAEGADSERPAPSSRLLGDPSDQFPG